MNIPSDEVLAEAMRRYKARTIDPVEFGKKIAKTWLEEKEDRPNE